MTNVETPITDAAEREGGCLIVSTCRKLERDLNAATAELAALREQLGKGIMALPPHTQLRWPSVDFKTGQCLATTIRCVTEAHAEESAKAERYRVALEFYANLEKGNIARNALGIPND